MSQKPALADRSLKRGKLRIGNDWNAITIIALSQSNPLKAVAELVENSIDARATGVSITRGRSEGNTIWKSVTTGKVYRVLTTDVRISATWPHTFAIQ
jgi:hypothetical protein